MGENVRLRKARRAYEHQDVKEAARAHTKVAIAHEPHEEGGKYLKDFVYGAIDGAITTFAIVAGVTGASLSAGIVLILGFANLLADGFSMAAGNFISTKSDFEFEENERRRELWEIKHFPDAEREEVHQIFKKKGFRGKLLEDAVKTVTSNKKVWLEVMMTDELGMGRPQKSPTKAGMATFAAFVVVGLIPLLSYVAAWIFKNLLPYAFAIAAVLTGIALFSTGFVKAKFSHRNSIVSGIETLLVGGAAAFIAFLVGAFLKTLGLFSV